MTSPSWAEPSYDDSPAGDLSADMAADIDDGYPSPVMSRLGGRGELTLDLLREQVPLLQAGHAAQEAITAAAPEDDVTDLLIAVNAGFAAQERLVLAGIPLIKHIAHREMTRRKRWRTQVTHEDLFQEGVAGLLRGLMAYNPAGGQKSPTNYLGQWIQVEMRRNVESIDNDFAVAYDATERFRKIRALRSRLAGELGREPTDEEIIAASLDPTHRGGRNIGRLVKSATPRRPLTLAHLEEERQMRYRVGATTRLHEVSDDDTPGVAVIAMARPLDGIRPEDIDESTLVQSGQQGLARVIATTLTRMRVGQAQGKIIALRYGLGQAGEPASARDIADALMLQRTKVSNVIDAFSTHMSTPHGVFHQVCAEHSDTDLASMGLGWVMSTLGPCNPAQAPSVPTLLTAPLPGSVARSHSLPTREAPRGRHG